MINILTGIATDLYELTMTAGYFKLGMNFPVVFELSIRHLPPNRGYLIAYGVEDAIDYITSLKFTEEEIQYLRNLEVFRNIGADFFDFLRNFSFKGDVWTVKDGTIVFANEPIIQVEASLLEAQMLETYLLSIVNFQTNIATKASRVVLSAKGRDVIEFGFRRAHGIEAGVLAAKAAFIAGCIGTSNVLAGYKYNIPVFGTTAHSWTMVSPSELQAFKNYHSVFPENTILLIDTYDVVKGAKKAIQIGKDVKGVRIDSGNLIDLSKTVRKLLDDAGMLDTKIILSGDLNEYIIEEIIKKKTPVNTFGVGTELVTSKDAPALSGIYKVVQESSKGYEHPLMKLSKDKVTLPGKKQIFRYEKNGFYQYDILALYNENVSKGFPLLRKAIEKGKRIYPKESLLEIRKYVQQQLMKLPEKYKRIKNPALFKVKISKGLKKIIQSRPKVIITRPKKDSKELTNFFRNNSLEVINLPMIRIIGPKSWREADKEINQLNYYDGIVFTSSNAVSYFIKRIKKMSKEDMLQKLNIFAIGEKTKVAIEKYGLKCSQIPEKYSSNDLANLIIREKKEGYKILFPKGDLANDELEKRLAERGIEVKPLIIYRNIKAKINNPYKKKIVDLLNNIDLKVIVFFSPSAVRNFMEEFKSKALMNNVHFAVIGDTTEKELLNYGLSADIKAKKPTWEELGKAVISYLESE